MMAFGIKDDNAFAEMLINDAGVAVVPGSGFGAPGHFRASFATSMATLEKMHRAHEEGARSRTGQEVRLNLTGLRGEPMNSAVPTPVTRADIAAWILVALALGLIIELHLLSGLLAGLLVFKLVDVLTPWLRLRALGRDGPRVLAVTLIATAVIAALIGIGVGIVALHAQ